MSVPLPALAVAVISTLASVQIGPKPLAETLGAVKTVDVIALLLVHPFVPVTTTV